MYITYSERVPTLSVPLNEYTWPLNNAGLRGSNPLHDQKPAYNFDSPQNWTMNSPLSLETLLRT